MRSMQLRRATMETSDATHQSVAIEPIDAIGAIDTNGVICAIETIKKAYDLPQSTEEVETTESIDVIEVIIRRGQRCDR